MVSLSLSPSAPALDSVLDVLSLRLRAEVRGLHPRSLAHHVQQRMRDLDARDEHTYLRLLRHSDEEAHALLDALLGDMRTFFADPEMFDALADVVLPALPASLLDGRWFTAWVLAAGTGEEVYSLAAVLAGSAALRRCAGCEVLATDANAHVLEAAGAALYPVDQLEQVPERWQGLAITRGTRGAIRERVRRLVTFEQHDFRGPRLAPASSVLATSSLVLARNALRGLPPRGRARVEAGLASVIAPGGVLILGRDGQLVTDASERFTPHPGVPPELGILRRHGGRS